VCLYIYIYIERERERERERGHARQSEVDALLREIFLYGSMT